MKSFKEFHREKELIQKILNKQVICIFESKDESAGKIVEFLIEGGNTYEIGKGYSFRADKAHIPGQKDHNHVLFKGHEVGAINKDGTSSHNTDISKFPNYVLDAMRKKGCLDEAIQEKVNMKNIVRWDLYLGVGQRLALIEAIQQSENILFSCE